MLSRLELRLGRIMALMGLGTAMLGGEAGGVAAAMVVRATAAPLGVVEPVRAVAGRLVDFSRGRNELAILLELRQGEDRLRRRGGLHQRVTAVLAKRELVQAQ